jgi:predicted nicotinamide N-methyase
LYHNIAGRYDVVTEDIALGTETLRILAVADTNQLLDRIDPAAFARDERLPYWAELWSSSVGLGWYCTQRPGLAGSRVLELGTGLGLAGIAAARAGARVTLTDYEPDALLFAQYNALVNLPRERVNALMRFHCLDWRSPYQLERYHVIVGSDIVYDRANFAPLLALFERALEPDGMIVLTEPGRSVGADFLSAAEGRYSIETDRRHVVRRGTETTITCSVLRPRGTACTRGGER